MDGREDQRDCEVGKAQCDLCEAQCHSTKRQAENELVADVTTAEATKQQRLEQACCVEEQVVKLI
jgi:hypothetical protein